MDKYIDLDLALRYVANMRVIFDKLVDQFLIDYRDFETKIRSLVNSKDFRKSFEVIHTLKGITKNLGAVKLFDECLNIEVEIMSKEVSTENLENFIFVYNKSYQELQLLNKK